ncbi:MAG: hypothetical protein NVS3B20_13600 [Polyangiales bacterium]
MSDDQDLQGAAAALQGGRYDDAIATLEALADRGVVGSGVAFDRGLAYASRARSPQSELGDLGRAAHAFEEALRRDPHDRQAEMALDEVRHEVARRNAQNGGRAEEVGAQPAWRTVVTSAPSNAWVALAIAGSMALAVALALRPRLARGARLAASTIGICGLFVAIVFSALGLGARHLHLHVREGVIVAPRAVATSESDQTPLDLSEGARVDVLEERATTTHVQTSKGDGWVARDAVRLLPPFRP